MIPRSSQLEKDLMNNAVERLHQWMLDTVMRCEVAQIPKSHILEIVGIPLMEALITLFKAHGTSRKTVIELFKASYDIGTRED